MGDAVTAPAAFCGGTAADAADATDAADTVNTAGAADDAATSAHSSRARLHPVRGGVAVVGVAVVAVVVRGRRVVIVFPAAARDNRRRDGRSGGGAPSSSERARRVRAAASARRGVLAPPRRGVVAVEVGVPRRRAMWLAAAVAVRERERGVREGVVGWGDPRRGELRVLRAGLRTGEAKDSRAQTLEDGEPGGVGREARRGVIVAKR